MKLFGKMMLGLGYSLVFVEVLLLLVILLVLVWLGGIFLLLVKVLCLVCGSKVGDGMERKLGFWLMLMCF